MWLRLYTYGLLGSLYLDQWLWFVYLLHLGYSPVRTGIAYAVMQAVRFALDIPSSMLADRFGQRPVLVAGGLLKCLSSLLFLLAGRGFGFVVAGSAFTALALTLPSGVDLSYVRTLAERSAASGREGSLQLRRSRYMSMQALAGVGAGMIGGLIATASFPLLYEADAALSLLASGVALRLLNLRPEPTSRGHGQAWYAPLVQTLRVVAGTPSGFWRLAALIIPLWTFSSVGTEYTQALLQRDGLQPIAISLAFTLAGGAGWLGSLISGRIPESRRNTALRLLVWLYPVSAAVRSFAIPGRNFAAGEGVAGIAAGRLGSGACSVLVNTALLERAPTAHRATVLSAVNTIQMAAMMLLFPALGVVSDAAGVAFVFVVLAGGLVLVAGGMQLALRGIHPSDADRASA